MFLSVKIFQTFKIFLILYKNFRYVPERLRPREFPQYGTSDWMRELGKVTAEIKGKMMTAGTIMISYQPLGEYPNFFRSIISNQVKIIQKKKNGILLPKLFWPTVRKNCSSDRSKLLKFEAECREFAKFLRSLERFFSNSEISVQFLKQNALTLFLEISQI